jgi:hypothetical protein
MIPNWEYAIATDVIYFQIQYLFMILYVGNLLWDANLQC